MKYPEYPTDLERRQPLRGFLGLFARMETGVSSDIAKLSWSQHLAELSRLFYLDDKQRTRKRANIVRGLQDVPPLHKPLQETLLFVNNHNEVVRLQQKTHQHVIDELRDQRLEYEKAGQYNADAGRMTELAALGLLTRYAHPWVLVAPSLPHHDSEATLTSRHYDIALAVGNKDNEELYTFQVKKGCSGRCGNHATYDYAKKYQPHIQIVSGCCDLGIHTTWQGTVDDRTVRLLVAEFDETASADDIHYLDSLTDNLIFNASADLLPRGTADPVAFAKAS